MIGSPSPLSQQSRGCQDSAVVLSLVLWRIFLPFSLSGKGQLAANGFRSSSPWENAHCSVSVTCGEWRWLQDPFGLSLLSRGRAHWKRCNVGPRLGWAHRSTPAAAPGTLRALRKGLGREWGMNLASAKLLATLPMKDSLKNYDAFNSFSFFTWFRATSGSLNPSWKKKIPVSGRVGYNRKHSLNGKQWL